MKTIWVISCARVTSRTRRLAIEYTRFVNRRTNSLKANSARVALNSANRSVPFIQEYNRHRLRKGNRQKLIARSNSDGVRPDTSSASVTQDARGNRISF